MATKKTKLVMKPAYRLRDWTIDLTRGYPCLIGISPDQKSEFLKGRLFRTSAVLQLNFVIGLAETEHSIYKLE